MFNHFALFVTNTQTALINIEKKGREQATKEEEAMRCLEDGGDPL